MASTQQSSTNKPASVAHGEMGLATRLTHSGTKPTDWAHKPVMTPIYTTTTFEVEEPGFAVYDYSRSGNPTRTELEKYLANIESAKYGLAFSSGLGAVTTASFLLKAGQHILCSDDVYGGTFRLFSKCLDRMGITTTYVNGTVLENWTKNFQQGKTKIVWIETPSNPLLKIIDIQAVVKAVKKLDQDCIVLVDNTFITPVFQSPLKLGADIILHSCSKYLSGHSDIIMGALITNSTDLHEKLKFLQNSLGIVPSPHDCSLLIRSIKTLEVRVRKQTENAMEIAKYLEDHPLVESVIYPGLKSHPQHELAARQCTGFGAMVSVYLKMVKGDEPKKFVKAVNIFCLAESLGCVCSLIEIPSLMTHASVPPETRKELGLTDNLLRLSIGIEDSKDLIGDLEDAFKSAYEN